MRRAVQHEVYGAWEVNEDVVLHLVLDDDTRVELVLTPEKARALATQLISWAKVSEELDAGLLALSEPTPECEEEPNF